MLIDIHEYVKNQKVYVSADPNCIQVDTVRYSWTKGWMQDKGITWDRIINASDEELDAIFDLAVRYPDFNYASQEEMEDWDEAFRGEYQPQTHNCQTWRHVC